MCEMYKMKLLIASNRNVISSNMHLSKNAQILSPVDKGANAEITSPLDRNNRREDKASASAI